jgi:hypothetical protein
MVGCGSHVESVLERTAMETNRLARLIVRKDPAGCCGEELVAGKVGSNGGWAWYRLFGFDDKLGLRALQCDAVRDATSEETLELEEAVGNGIHLVRCFVAGVMKARIAVLG